MLVIRCTDLYIKPYSFLLNTLWVNHKYATFSPLRSHHWNLDSAALLQEPSFSFTDSVQDIPGWSVFIWTLMSSLEWSVIQLTSGWNDGNLDNYWFNVTVFDFLKEESPKNRELHLIVIVQWLKSLVMLTEDTPFNPNANFLFSRCIGAYGSINVLVYSQDCLTCAQLALHNVLFVITSLSCCAAITAIICQYNLIRRSQVVLWWMTSSPHLIKPTTNCCNRVFE